jgi:hypothetical protein
MDDMNEYVIIFSDNTRYTFFARDDNCAEEFAEDTFSIRTLNKDGSKLYRLTEIKEYNY